MVGMIQSSGLTLVEDMSVRFAFAIVTVEERDQQLQII